MKIIILLLSCNIDRFPKEAYEMKKALNNQINKYNLNEIFDIYDYVGNSEKTYIKNSTIYVNANDDYNKTYDKTLKCFQFINENLNYDYIFRTNTSTFINIKLLYEFIKRIDCNENKLKLYSSVLLSINNVYCPYNKYIHAHGKGMIFNRDIINILLNNSYNFKKYNNGGYLIKENKQILDGIDDVCISACLNTYHIEHNENYIKYIGVFNHMNVFHKSFIKSFINKTDKLFEYVQNFITIALKDMNCPDNSNIDKIQFLDNLFITNTIKNSDLLVILNLVYDIEPNVFVGINAKKPFIKLNRYKEQFRID